MATEKMVLKQTKGTFEVRGTIFGMEKETAFKRMVNKSGHEQHMMNIGIKIAEGEVIFLALNGSADGDVYFSKMGKKGEKPEMKTVKWELRNRPQGDGFKLIGVGLALHKDENTGKNEEVKNFTPFDAIDEIQENLQDGMSVFVKGNIEYGSYLDDATKETRKTVKYVPTGIYLAQNDIDFKDEKFEKNAGFAQHLIFNKVRKEEDGTFSLDFGVVGYNSYEENTIPVSADVANKLRENVKPYTALTVTGVLKTNQVVETTPSVVWGEESTVGKAKTSGKTVMFVNGARPETIDKENYTKKTMDAWLDYIETVKKEKTAKSSEFESQDGAAVWGNKSKVAQTEEEDVW